MSNEVDDWEQVDEIEAPTIVAPVPQKKKIAILSRPSTNTNTNTGSSGLAGFELRPLGETEHFGMGQGPGGGSGGVPKILKRNPNSIQQHGSPISRGEPQFNDRNINTRQEESTENEDQDSVEGARRQMNGLSLRDQNRALWDQANAYEQPIISRSDSSRTEYVPEIRILRRPKSPVQAVRVSPQVKPKSLAQREADYNAAREKIFGPSPSSTPTLSSPNDTNPSPTGQQTYSGGAASPRRQSPSIRGGGGGGSPSSSRPSSRPGSRPSSPSTMQQTQIYTTRHNSAFENAVENVKPIEFRDGPPLSRRGGGSGGGRGSGPEVVNTVIRQPLGPTSLTSGHISTSKSRGRGRGRGGSNHHNGSKSTTERSRPGDTGSPRSEGSIGFHRPIMSCDNSSQS